MHYKVVRRLNDEEHVVLKRGTKPEAVDLLRSIRDKWADVAGVPTGWSKSGEYSVELSKTELVVKLGDKLVDHYVIVGTS